MTQELHILHLSSERDVVTARQQARSIAALLGFDHHDQIRLATAVSEIARNAYRYATGGVVIYSVSLESQMFRVDVRDKGNGIPHLDDVLNGSYKSSTGMGMGILGTKRLMDEFAIDSSAAGTSVYFGKRLPTHHSANTATFHTISKELVRQTSTPIDELQTQNRELLKTLNELRERKDELLHMNAELQDTNRGVVALYAELDERADYLRRASELKTSFLSNMSHEFRTPLNSMLALTRMLLDRMDGDLTEEQEQQIRFIQRAAKELAEMVDDLLDLAKVEAGRLDVKPKQFDVSDLFGALRGMLKPLLAESSLTLVFESGEDLPPLFTDEQKVSQILRNFISNAIKFTPRGEVRICARNSGSSIEFSVSDTGIGISTEDQRVIFEEFAQVDSSLQRRVKGTGLGLPLSRKLAELLGGSVSVQSTVGVGSIFTAKIPVTFGHGATTERTDDLKLDPIRQFVLIVEDNPETAFIYCRYLELAGFQTRTVTTVAEAKKLLKTATPAAIILDVLLRSENTWEFLAQLKSTQCTVPVLVISVTDDERKVFGLGADGYMMKPFHPEQMIEAVVRLTSVPDRIKILMIDDNEVSRYLLRSQLPESRYKVYEACDGREGIRLANELLPAVIFLDFLMPGLNGIEVIKDLRNSQALASTSLVLHSTKILDESEVKLLQDYGVCVFPKHTLTLPDCAVTLRQLIDTLICHSRTEPHNA